MNENFGGDSIEVSGKAQRKGKWVFYSLDHTASLWEVFW